MQQQYPKTISNTFLAPIAPTPHQHGGDDRYYHHLRLQEQEHQQQQQQQEQHALDQWHQSHMRDAADAETLQLIQNEYNDEEAKNSFSEKDIEPLLSHDIYSLLYTTRFFGLGFLFSFLMYLLQTSLALMLFFDLFSTVYKTNNIPNRMMMPPGVDGVVTTAQFLGLILVVIIMVNEGDLVAGVSRLAEGYDSDLLERSCFATFTRWLITAVLQVLNGVIFIFLSFITVMQSGTVLSLFLNLTGLYFLQEIDNVGFHFASTGILGENVQFDCQHVEGLKQYVPKEMKARMRLINRIVVILCTMGLLVPYGIFAAQQHNGKYLCKNLYVQFGDSVYPQYAYFSGKFELQTQSLWEKLVGSGRPTYLPESLAELVNVSSIPPLYLTWCPVEKVWTFVELDKDACKDYVFKSSETSSYNVLAVADSAWFVKTPIGADVPVDWLKVACIDCEHNTDLCKGICKNNKCMRDSYAPFTEGVNFEIPRDEDCTSFATDFSTKASLAGIPGVSFLKKEEHKWFPLTPNVTVFDRFVYFFSNKGYADIPVLESPFLLFGGRRWIAFGVDAGKVSYLTEESLAKFMEMHGNATPTQLLIQLNNSQIFQNHKPLLFSSPVNYGTDSAVASLDGVKWYRSKEDFDDRFFGHSADEANPVGLKLQCPFCSAGNSTHVVQGQTCYNGGTCDSFGYCNCPAFYGGFRCEYAFGCGETGKGCLNGGTCDMQDNSCTCQPGFSGNLCQFGSFEIEDMTLCGHIACDQADHSSCHCACRLGSWDPNLCSKVLLEASGNKKVGLDKEDYHRFFPNGTDNCDGVSCEANPKDGCYCGCYDWNWNASVCNRVRFWDSIQNKDVYLELDDYTKFFPNGTDFCPGSLGCEDNLKDGCSCSCGIDNIAGHESVCDKVSLHDSGHSKQIVLDLDDYIKFFPNGTQMCAHFLCEENPKDGCICSCRMDMISGHERLCEKVSLYDSDHSKEISLDLEDFTKFFPNGTHMCEHFLCEENPKDGCICSCRIDMISGHESLCNVVSFWDSSSDSGLILNLDEFNNLFPNGTRNCDKVFCEENPKDGCLCACDWSPYQSFTDRGCTTASLFDSGDLKWVALDPDDHTRFFPNGTDICGGVSCENNPKDGCYCVCYPQQEALDPTVCDKVYTEFPSYIDYEVYKTASCAELSEESNSNFHCQNGGSCDNGKCTCTQSYGGRFCEIWVG